MESVLGAGGKPNCLVIDEIDGAPVVGLLGALVGGQVGGQRLGLTVSSLHSLGCHQRSFEHPGPQGPTACRVRGSDCSHKCGTAAPGRGGATDEASHLHLQ